jgi:hypothetical protein
MLSLTTSQATCQQPNAQANDQAYPHIPDGDAYDHPNEHQ